MITQNAAHRNSSRRCVAGAHAKCVHLQFAPWQLFETMQAQVLTPNVIIYKTAHSTLLDVQSQELTPNVGTRSSWDPLPPRVPPIDPDQIGEGLG